MIPGKSISHSCQLCAQYLITFSPVVRADPLSVSITDALLFFFIQNPLRFISTFAKSGEFKQNVPNFISAKTLRHNYSDTLSFNSLIINWKLSSKAYVCSTVRSIGTYVNTTKAS